MIALIRYVSGKKTYLVAAAIGLLVYLKMTGVIDQSTFETLVALFGAGGMATMRSAIQKAEDAACPIATEPSLLV